MPRRKDKNPDIPKRLAEAMLKGKQSLKSKGVVLPNVRFKHNGKEHYLPAEHFFECQHCNPCLATLCRALALMGSEWVMVTHEMHAIPVDTDPDDVSPEDLVGNNIVRIVYQSPDKNCQCVLPFSYAEDGNPHLGKEPKLASVGDWTVATGES